MSETHVIMKLKNSNTWSPRDITIFWKTTFYAFDANPERLIIIAIFQHIWNAMKFTSTNEVKKLKHLVIKRYHNVLKNCVIHMGCKPKMSYNYCHFKHIWNVMKFTNKIKTTVIINQFNVWTSFLLTHGSVTGVTLFICM